MLGFALTDIFNNASLYPMTSSALIC